MAAYLLKCIWFQGRHGSWGGGWGWLDGVVVVGGRREVQENEVVERRGRL